MVKALFDTRWQTLKAKKGGNPMPKMWGFFFGGSGHGPESSCQISAYYKFFPGKSYFYRTILQQRKKQLA